MEVQFIRDQITRLRLKLGMSEYQLSYDLGHNQNYIHNIASGHSLPSVRELLFLIDTLGVTPRDFFDEEQQYSCPLLAKELMDSLRGMEEQDLKLILDFVKRIKELKELAEGQHPANNTSGGR